MLTSTSEKTEITPKLIALFGERGLRAGDRLPPEQELARALGVSRPVIREALSVLEVLGLCHTRKGSGRVVAAFHFGNALNRLLLLANPSTDWLNGLLAVRQALEGAMLPLAISSLSKEALAELERLTSAMEAKAQRGEYFGDEDRRFHLTLYSPLKNDVLNGLLHLFWSMYDRLDETTLSHSQRLDETAAHHRKILSALQAGDIRRAQHQLDAHFYDTAYALEHRHTI